MTLNHLKYYGQEEALGQNVNLTRQVRTISLIVTLLLARRLVGQTKPDQAINWQGQLAVALLRGCSLHQMMTWVGDKLKLQ